MPISIVCTVCSKEKRPDLGYLPAHKRYLGRHIGLVHEEATVRQMPFYILSGLHGLICADTLIGHYDYALTPEAAVALGGKVAEQVRALGIGQVHFYTKVTPAWLPYRSAMWFGATLGRAILFYNELGAEV